jgi:hypothetical protein
MTSDRLLLRRTILFGTPLLYSRGSAWAIW